MGCLIGLLAAVLLASGGQSYAQNTTCPTAAPGTNDNRCASTAFVQAAVILPGLTIGSTIINSGTTNRILYDNAGLLGELSVTGSGSVVRDTAPTISSLTVTTAFTATGLVTNADLANAATTVNGQSCVLGATCTVTAAAASLTVGVTTIASGTDGRLLYDNAGTLGELAVSSCSGANDALTWNGSFGCSTSLASLTQANQTLSGGANVTPAPSGTGDFTANCGAVPLQTYTNAGAATITAPANSGSCLILVVNNAMAGALTFSGFTVGSSTGDPFDTTDGHQFLLQITRIGATSTYLNKALQ